MHKPRVQCETDGIAENQKHVNSFLSHENIDVHTRRMCSIMGKRYETSTLRDPIKVFQGDYLPAGNNGSVTEALRLSKDIYGFSIILFSFI